MQRPQVMVSARPGVGNEVQTQRDEEKQGWRFIQADFRGGNYGADYLSLIKGQRVFLQSSDEEGWALGKVQVLEECKEGW